MSSNWGLYIFSGFLSINRGFELKLLDSAEPVYDLRVPLS